MKVTIAQTATRGFHLSLPTGLVLSRLTAWLLTRKLKKQGTHISSKDLYRFMKAVRRYKEDYPGWQLAEINGAKGERVIITL